jgi:hypothetical protein
MIRFSLLRVVCAAMVAATILPACGAPKRGCPTSSSSMGAERVLAGEKPEKKQKYKVKGMN